MADTQCVVDKNTQNLNYYGGYILLTCQVQISWVHWIWQAFHTWIILYFIIAIRIIFASDTE